jgi:hypothetical protein
MTTFVRFEHVPEDRTSEPYGPFEAVQLTYRTLRICPDGDELAALARDSECWRVMQDGSEWTDVVIYEGGEG